MQDIYVYNENNLTILGSDNKNHTNTYMIQVQLNADETDTIEDKASFERIKINRLINDKSCLVKPISNTRSLSLSVSNTRKVAALVSVFEIGDSFRKSPFD
jgi:hypothetical protein